MIDAGHKAARGGRRKVQTDWRKAEKSLKDQEE